MSEDTEFESFVDEINKRFREVRHTPKLFFETQGRRVYPIELTEDGQYYGKLTRVTPITDKSMSIEGIKRAIMNYVGQKKDLIVWSVYPVVDIYCESENEYVGYCVLYAE